jgi:predicted PurR-regulated permease PerM
MPAHMPPNWERPVLISLILGTLLVLGFILLRQFIVCVAWAGILVYSTWPLYALLQRRVQPNLAAAIMTVLLFTSLLLPLVWLLNALQSELGTTFEAVSGFIRIQPRVLPDGLARLPWLGDWLQHLLDRAPTDLVTFEAEVAGWIQTFRNELTKIVVAFGRFSVLLVLTLITAFFLYRDGEVLLARLRQTLHILIGDRVNAYFNAIGTTTKAVLYGLVLAALAQGSMAGIGYWAAGLEAPLLLATLTTMIAMIPVPFGTPLVWSAIGLWLQANDRTVPGIGLLLWGALVVSWIDNLVRPLVISGTARVHFLLVLFGILGGLTSFGLIGLFAGPAILATLAAVWRQWLADNSETTAPP